MNLLVDNLLIEHVRDIAYCLLLGVKELMC